MPRLLVLLSVIVGIAAGAVVAVAVPRHAATNNPNKLTVRRTAAPYPARVGGMLDIHLHGKSRILFTTPDPAGGPDWAIRAYSGTYIFPASQPRDRIGRELLGVKDCVELGRIHDGAFGWLDGAGTFRAIPAGRQGGPQICHAHGSTDRSNDSAAWTTWVSHPDFGEPQPLATLVWGTAPAPIKAITISPRRLGPPDLHRSADRRAFIAFLPAQGAMAHDTRVYATDDQGHQHRVMHTFLFRRTLSQGRLGARAPDPDGGAPWGLAVSRGPHGTWCSGNVGRVVGNGVGQINPRQDVFGDQTSFTFYCPTLTGRFKMSHNRPLQYELTSGATVDDTGAGATRNHGRIALRTDPGATVFGGIALPGVVSITVVTPTQTRTIRPTGPWHAFVIAFPGSFPSGRIQFVSHFADGTTATQDDHADDLS
jgi:hypothetical protein